MHQGILSQSNGHLFVPKEHTPSVSFCTQGLRVADALGSEKTFGFVSYRLRSSVLGIALRRPTVRSRSAPLDPSGFFRRAASAKRVLEQFGGAGVLIQ